MKVIALGIVVYIAVFYGTSWLLAKRDMRRAMSRRVDDIRGRE